MKLQSEWLADRVSGAKRRLEAPRDVFAGAGVVLLIMLCVVPVWNALALLRDTNYMFWAGPWVPFYLIAACLGVVLWYWLTIFLFFGYAPLSVQTEQTVLMIAFIFISLLGLVLMFASLPLSRQSLDTFNSLMHNCDFSFQTHRVYEYSQVLHNIRRLPECAKKFSVEECTGYQDSPPYTDFLRSLEQNFRCSGFCHYASVGSQPLLPWRRMTGAPTVWPPRQVEEERDQLGAWPYEDGALGTERTGQMADDAPAEVIVEAAPPTVLEPTEKPSQGLGNRNASEPATEQPMPYTIHQHIWHLPAAGVLERGHQNSGSAEAANSIVPDVRALPPGLADAGMRPPGAALEAIGFPVRAARPRHRSPWGSIAEVSPRGRALISYSRHSLSRAVIGSASSDAAAGSAHIVQAEPGMDMSPMHARPPGVWQDVEALHNGALQGEDAMDGAGIGDVPTRASYARAAKELGVHEAAAQSGRYARPPPALFSDSKYHATCEGMAARHMKNYAGDIALQSFYQGMYLVFISILTGFLKLLGFCVHKDQDFQYLPPRRG